MNELINKLLQYKHLIKYVDYNSNAIVFNEGDICREIGIVIKGEISISTITYAEKEETINIIKEGELFGDFLVFSPNPVYLGIGITNKKTTIAFIKRESILNIFIENKDILCAYLSYTSLKAIQLKLQTKLLSHKNIEDRIIYYFTITKENPVYISSITDFSKKLALPRPSVSRSLKVMEEKNIIKREKHFFYLLNKS
ncbi:MAG: Crp/Fnr family transcriptional regulator [Bacilli bacterium]|nr:Crp/Fnr family transcriptional regulator [Bacilli bacterium]MDD7315012.1 Crp/Fnr family transcriptional regulator [Bacilli bacterium]